MEPINPVSGGVARKKTPVLWVAVTTALVLLAAAVWYYYGYYGRAVLPGGPDAATSRLQSQGTSDEVSAIEQDLDATDLGDLDRELSDIDAELAP